MLAEEMRQRERMLAFCLPVTITFPRVILSLLAAVLGSWIALYLVRRRHATLFGFAVGSLLPGAGTATRDLVCLCTAGANMKQVKMQ
jgi:NO-binding membrane sensor protein with MHYT domain